MIPLEAIRSFDIILGIVVILFLTVLLAQRWSRMTFYSRMFGMALVAFTVAPLVGNIERLVENDDSVWADYTTFVGMAWIIMGLIAAVKNEDTEVHTCPACGTVHKVRLEDIVEPHHDHNHRHGD